MHSVKRQIAFLAALYLAFVIYGSLVPLNFQPVPWADALARWRDIPFLDLGIGSRADWVANLLLFIPLSFLFAALTWPRTLPAQWLTAGLIATGCVLLSLGIEFTQIFFPPRTVSQNDILAESLGGVLGLLAWWRWGGRVLDWWAGWREARGPAGLADRLYWGYLALLVGYALLPLDLTLNPVDVYHKWSEGRVHLLPFAGLPRQPVEFAYEVVTDIVIWVPVGVLGVVRGGHRVWARVLLLAGGIELAQLFVYTRVSDVTDLLTAGLGGWLGGWIAVRWLPGGDGQPAPAAAGADRRVGWIAAAVLGWCVLLALVFWYPFNFVIERQQVAEGVEGFFRVPFRAYYFGTEYRAVTEVLHKVGFFLPLGAGVAWLRRSLGWHGPLTAADALVLIGLAAVPLGIEFGQMLLPGKHPGSTDFVLAWLGIVAGYVGLLTLAPRWQQSATSASSDVAPATPAAAEASQPHSPGARHGSAGSMAALPAGWLCMQAMILAGLWAIPFVPAVPYNLRELLGGGAPVFLVGTALFLLGNGLVLGTTWLGQWLTRYDQLRPWRWPGVLIAAAATMALALLMVAPRESVHDVVGAPVLEIWPWLELFLRLWVLSLWPLVLLTGAAAVLNAFRSVDGRVVVRWLAPALPMLVLVHLVVVEGAATDNLTELMADGGGVLATAALSLAMLLLFFGSGVLAVAFAEGYGRLPALLGVAVFAACSWGLLVGGTESGIQKYGQSFSALQFLLSADRSSYVDNTGILVRYLVLYAVLSAALALGQFPVWWRLRRQRRPLPPVAHTADNSVRRTR